MAKKRKELVGHFNITYRWWRDDRQAIPSEHAEELEEHAKKHAIDLAMQGWQGGELNKVVFDQGEDIDYTGWWEAK